jgi:hypothetical protein
VRFVAIAARPGRDRQQSDCHRGPEGSFIPGARSAGDARRGLGAALLGRDACAAAGGPAPPCQVPRDFASSSGRTSWAGRSTGVKAHSRESDRLVVARTFGDRSTDFERVGDHAGSSVSAPSRSRVDGSQQARPSPPALVLWMYTAWTIAQESTNSAGGDRHS